jgi:tetratricopeptide (TPR) repeat protein
MKPEQSLDRIVRLVHDDPHYHGGYYEGDRVRIFAYLLSNVYKQHQPSAELLERLGKEKQLDCKFAISLANAYANMQDYESAENYYSMIVNRCPMTSLNRMGYAKSLYVTRNFDRAIQQFKILIRDTTAVPLYSFLGHSYIFENQTDSGVKYLDIAVSLANDSTTMMESLVDVLASDGRFEPALYFQKRLLQTDPDSWLYKQRYNRLLELSGDTAQ